MEEIERVASQLEKENNKKAAADPAVRAALGVVHDFLKNHSVMCYGGTAINNLLPSEDRFYDPEYEIPDYDFFSKTPQEHAMLIANKLAEVGIKEVEVKPGMHLGTFKVFADYAGVADITHLDKEIFDRLWKEDVVREGIHYVPPNFLRMSMYLELSRPQGDVSRWTKVYKRLELLNKHYPLTCPGAEEEPTPLSDTQRREVERILDKEDVVLLGITATQLHLGKRKPHWTTPVTLLASSETREKLAKGRKSKTHKGTDVLPSHTDIYDESGKLFLRVHETAACHSYHKVGSIKIASIPTILQFYFAYLYSGLPEVDNTHILCVAQRFLDIAAQKKKRRFALLTPADCLGNQETLVDMRKHKAVLYEKLGKNKSSPEFLKYFFAYNPRDTATRRKQVRDLLKKTRKARYESSY
jgi:hypothetical protein